MVAKWRGPQPGRPCRHQDLLLLQPADHWRHCPHPVQQLACQHRRAPTVLQANAHTVRMRSRDFFVLDYEATVEINGGHPAIYVLDDEFLSDLRSGLFLHVSDVSAAEGLCDLLEDELLGYVSRGRPSLSDGEVTEASRTLEAVTKRLGYLLQFRDFTTLDVYAGRFSSSRTTSMQSYRQSVLDFFKPLRSQLAEMEGRGDLEIKERRSANLRDPAAIRELLTRLQRTAQSDPPLAIGTAKELVESTAKAVLQERGQEVDDKYDLPTLVKRAQEAIGLHPGSTHPGPDSTGAVKRILGGLTTIVMGLGELRKRGYGTGHGPKGERVGLRLGVPNWPSMPL